MILATIQHKDKH